MPVPVQLMLIAPLQSVAPMITIKGSKLVPWNVHRICEEPRAPFSCRASEDGPVVSCCTGQQFPG